MKSVQISFVEPKAWKAVWAGAGLVLLCIVTFTGIQLWQLHQSKAALQAELDQLQAQRLQQQAHQSPASPVVNLRSASEAAAARLLQRDWNVVFDAIETPALAKVRLVQFSFDAQTGQSMLEYELERMEQAVQVTEALNATESGHVVWQLERLENTTQSSVGSVGRVRGVWRALVD